MAKKLARQALGYDAVMGDLYDVRTDCLSKENIFESAPLAAIETQEISLSQFRPIHSDEISDVLSILEVEGGQQLSIVSKLCDPKGLVSQLATNLSSTSRRPVLGILHTLKTQKKMLSSNGQWEDKLSKPALKNNPVGHFIAEITYGVNTFLSLELKEEGLGARDIDGTLKEILAIVEGHKHSQSFEANQEAVASLNKLFKMHIFSDLSGTSIPVDSLEHALEIIENVPNQVESINESKGMPLSFALMPISKVGDTPSGHQQLQTVAEEEILPVLRCFDEMVKIRQKVSKTYEALQEHEDWMSEEDLDRISMIQTRTKASFKKFQKDLPDSLKEVRSGKNPSALRSLITKAEDKTYSAKLVEKMLLGFKPTLKKIAVMEAMQDKGVHYVGKEDKLDKALKDIKAEDVYVLRYSTKASKNKAQWMMTRMAFLGYASDPKNACVLVDADFHTSDKHKYDSTIMHYKNGEMVDGDESEDEENDSEDDESGYDNGVSTEEKSDEQCTDSNYVAMEDEAEVQEDEVLCYAESSDVKPTTSNPRKKAYLKMVCPGATFSVAGQFLCSSTTKTWNCSKCQSIIIYGFDENFYCACGSASCHSYRFYCDDRRHGQEDALAASSRSDSAKFVRLLNSLEPLKELNIVIMGETGVGKSTWINSFVNYLTYDTMEEAEKHGPKYLIGSSFVMTDEEYQPVDIKMGPVENDNNMKGQSVTQMPNSYIFTAGELMVRLVDTPGVGDTRGIDQDKINFQNVLSHLSHLEDLNGICVLLKSNSARLTITFQFCIKELLTHLHKDACKNIVFIFTNARETFYRPGDTFSTLRNLLGENKDIVISLGKETLYCMDNESMRFLAATNQGMIFNDEDRENYSNSWKKAVNENERLVQHILALRPHSTRQTISLNEARRLILGLTEPLVQISQNIQNNIILAQNRRDEIDDIVARSEDLKGKLKIPVMDIVAQELPYPRTVCTSSNCVESRVVEGVTKVHYKTWCHEHCYLKNVQVQQYPCPELRRCAAMNGSGSCNICSCSWDVHMHLTYESVEVSKQVIDKNVEDMLEKESDAIKAVEKFLEDVQDRLDGLKAEQATINRVASKCGTFLKQNAITPYNDSVDEYLQQCIRIQKDLVSAGASDKTLKGLERMLDNYKQEVKILEMAMKDDAAGHRIDPDDIPRLIEELYALPINGKSLKDFVDVAVSAKHKMVAYQEKVYTTPYRKKESFLKRAWKKLTNTF